jgi:hypothetical protein
LDDAAKAALSQFSQPGAEVRARLQSALLNLRPGADAAAILDALNDEAEREGQQAALAAACAELLGSDTLQPLPRAARLQMLVQIAWLCGQQDGLEACTLLAATQALELAPADERALAIAEPLLLDAEQYSELSNR